MKPLNEPTRALSLRIDHSLYMVLRETADLKNVTMTEIIEDYLRYLQKQPKKQRELIDAKTPSA